MTEAAVEPQLPAESVSVQPAEQQRRSSEEDDKHPEPMQTTKEV